MLLEEVVDDEFQFIYILDFLIHSRIGVRVDEVAVEQPLRPDDVGPGWSETVTMRSRGDAIVSNMKKFKFIFHAESAPLHAELTGNTVCEL